MRSMRSSERIEEMVFEFEGCRWDAIFLSETWRREKSEIWEIHHKPIFMGAGKYNNKHGVGIMLNKKWRQRIIDTEYINERTITATIVVNRQRIKLMSVYFSHLGYADHQIEKMYKTIEKHTTKCKRYIFVVGGDFNAEQGPGHTTECISVGRYTLNEGNKRVLDETLADVTRIHSTQRDVQKYLRYNKDAEANDMIHMGSDHRCAMATFTITTLGKSSHSRTIKGKHEIIKHEERERPNRKTH